MPRPYVVACRTLGTAVVVAPGALIASSFRPYGTPAHPAWIALAWIAGAVALIAGAAVMALETSDDYAM